MRATIEVDMGVCEMNPQTRLGVLGKTLGERDVLIEFVIIRNWLGEQNANRREGVSKQGSALTGQQPAENPVCSELHVTVYAEI